jgi:hypothetical protein
LVAGKVLRSVATIMVLTNQTDRQRSEAFDQARNDCASNAFSLLSEGGIEMEREYSRIPERALRALEGFPTAYRQDIEDDVARFSHVAPRAPDSDGAVEVLHGVEMTHRFVQAPGESEAITWHYVQAGQGRPVVLLHGVPDSWYL